jgi:transposase
VLGAVNFATKSIVTITNNTYITATQVCEMLWKLRELHKGEHLFIVLDNARYQKCYFVQELAKHLSISLIYIPPYSPNLNLIERYWKFVKGKLRSKYYSNFAEFTSRIDDIIHNPNEEDNKHINQIISNNFQLFDELVQITENTYVDTKSTKNIA